MTVMQRGQHIKANSGQNFSFDVNKFNDARGGLDDEPTFDADAEV